MKRTIGLILAAVLVQVVDSKAQAQAPADHVNGSGPAAGSILYNLPAGGFGYDYAQTLPANSYVLDRWWMVVPTPAIETVPATVTSAQPAPTGQLAPAARRAGGRRLTSRAAVPATSPLPTGSLAWPGAGAVTAYTPGFRYNSYDYGYARSPYGSMDYGMAYKGYSWGY